MDQDLELKIVLTGDGRSLNGTINLSRDEFRGLSKEMGRSSDASRKLDRSMDKTAKSVDKTGVAMKRAGQLAAAYFSGQAVLGAIKAADAWGVLQQRIETATKATGDYIMVSEQLYRITRENGAAMQGSVSLFQSISRARKELGATNKDVLTLTGTIQKLGVIGGSSIDAMKFGTLQFSQMMAGGVARAEELNSLFENLPEVAARIAKGMNMTQGELRNAVLQGRLLSKDIFKSLLKQAPEISAEFEGIPLSLSRATQSLGTSFDHFLGQLNEATGLTGLIAEGFEGLANMLDRSSQKLAEPTGEYKLNQLIEKRLEIEQRIDRLQQNRSVRNQILVGRLKTSLEQVMADIETTKKSLQAALTDDGHQGGNGGNSQAKIAFLKQYNALMAEGKKLTEEARTPLEQYDAQIEHLFDLYGVGAINLETLNRLEGEYKETLNDATGVTAKLKAEEKARSKLLDEMLDQYIAEEQAVAEAHDAKRKLIGDLRNELELMQYSGRELAIQTELRKAHAQGILDQDDAIRRLAGSLYDARERAKRFGDEADDVAKAWEEAGNRIDETFADAWSGAFDSFKDFSDRLKQAFQDLLGELAHQAYTRPILVNLGMQGVVGGGGYAGAPGGGGAGGGSIGGTLLSSGSNFAMSSLFSSGSAGAGAAAPVLMDTGGGLMVEMPFGGGAGVATGGSFLSTAGGAFVGYNVASHYGGWGGAIGGVAAGAGTAAIMGGASSLAAGGSFGAGAYGAMAGMGPVGWIALIIAALYGAFGNRSDPDARMATYRDTVGRDQMTLGMTQDDHGNSGFISNVEYAPHDWEDNVSVDSAFGVTGFANRGSKDIDTRNLWPQLRNMAAIDDAISQAYGDEVTENISEALDGWYDQTWSATEGRIEEMFAARFYVILGELEEAGYDYVDMVTETGNNITEWANNLSILKASTEAGLEFESMEEAAAAWTQFTNVNIAIAQLTDLWMTQEERLRRAKEALDEFNNEIDRSGNAYIDTRDELQDYIAGLDLTTQAGRDLAEQALAMAGILDYAATTTRELADQQLSNTRNDLVAALTDEINGLERQRATLEEAVATAHEQYTDALRENIDAQQEALSSAQAAAADWSDIAKTLADAQTDILSAALSPGDQMGVAGQRLNETVQAAWQGNQESMRSLPGLANEYLFAAQREAGSSQDYLRTVLSVRSQLATAEDLAETQATRQQRLADAAEAQVAALEKQLAETEGLNDNVMSLEQAYKNLQKAEFELAATAFDEQIRQHEAVLASLTGIDDGVNRLADAMTAYLDAGGTLTSSTNSAHYAPTPDDFGPVVGYASGGISRGPLSGYPVELHGTEAVIPLPDNSTIPVTLTTLSKPGDIYHELVAEIRALREELAAAQSENRTIGVETIKAVKKTAKVLDRWDMDGQPAERSVA
ncbi:MAG: tape measure protein [Candidatus Thiodiazotropha sp. (ex Dulcina madagascariensis)]|nr:tape measure protein [Candidatus Thiodiazotropha sp. (ex Dulcina madagascariensis)]